MHTFGASAPLKELQRKFGFEPGRVADAAREQLRKHGLVDSRRRKPWIRKRRSMKAWTNYAGALFPSLHHRKEGWLRHQGNVAKPAKRKRDSAQPQVKLT